MYSQVHYVISLELNFGFTAFFNTFMFLVLKTECFYFFVKLEMTAIFVFKMAANFFLTNHTVSVI